MKITFREWHFGSFYCSFNQFISLCSVPASVLTMLAITLDRRRAIMSPLHPRTTRLMALIILAVIWALSALMAVPPAINSDTFSVTNKRFLKAKYYFFRTKKFLVIIMPFKSYVIIFDFCI